MILINGLTEEQWAFAQAVAGLVARDNSDLARYRKALEELRDSYLRMHDDPWVAKVAREALEG